MRGPIRHVLVLVVLFSAFALVLCYGKPSLGASTTRVTGPRTTVVTPRRFALATRGFESNRGLKVAASRAPAPLRPAVSPRATERPHATKPIASMNRRTPKRSRRAPSPHILPAVAMIASVMTLAARADELAAAATDVEEKKGWFNSIVSTVETGILLIANFLKAQGVENSTGVAIILFTILVRTLVLPLNVASLKSSAMMQAISPRMKKIQEKFKDDKEMQGALILQTYQMAGINPVAGLIPAFAQIPVFIAFYRALSNLAKADKLSEAFLWLPSLEGPTFGEQNLDWLTKGWDGLNPPLGWHDTAAYLALPVLYVIGQSWSQKLLAPPQAPNPDGSPAPGSAFTNFLPFLIGWFSLNVPSALILYWVVSNVYSVGASLTTRAILNNDPKVKDLKKRMELPIVFEDEKENLPDYLKEAFAQRETGSTSAPAVPSSNDIMDALASSSSTQQSRSDRGARFRALKAQEAGESVEVPPVKEEEPQATRGSRFRALKEAETKQD